MNLTRRATVAMLLMSAWLIGASSAPSLYVQPGDVDYQSILSGPPANDSAEHRGEVAEMLHEQARRTAEQVDRCRSEVILSPTVFDSVLGDGFNVRRYPQTIALLAQAKIDADKIGEAAKKHWKRPRPYLDNANIHPCLKLEKNTSYPSGHASCAEVWARILAEIYPDKKQALLDRARLVGTDRTLGGVHYPSDVVAGLKLGDAIADKMLSIDDFQAALNQAKAECAAVAP